MKKVKRFLGIGKEKKKGGGKKGAVDTKKANQDENTDNNHDGLAKVESEKENIEASDLNKVETNCYIKLSGLPGKATVKEIADFLSDCDIIENNVIIKHEEGKASSDAYVKLTGKADQERALKFNKKYFQEKWFIVIEKTDCHTYNKYIDKIADTKVEHTKKEDDGLSKVKPREEIQKLEDKQEPNKTTTYCYIRLSGLPWKSTENEIANFLVDCNIVGSVIIINNEHGKPSGDAVVKLKGISDLEKAMKCHKKYLHDRFIVIEEITSDTYNKHNVNVDNVEEASKQENAFLKLSGLVWTATEEDIKTFLDDCTVTEVVITTNEGGKPSGNAFVRLEDKLDTEKAKGHDKEYLGERYVKVEVIEEQQFIKDTEKDRKMNAKEPIIVKKKRGGNSQTIQFLIKLKGAVDEEDAMEECKDIMIDGITWGTGKLKKSEIELECTARGDIEEEVIKREIEKLHNYVKHVQIVEKGKHGNVRNSMQFKFEIRPADHVSDEEEVIEECKDIELEGVVWGKGEIVPGSDRKSKIELECTVENSNTDALSIQQKLVSLGSVEDVSIIK
eukprot:GFUD01015300.1.p1 GENE.GFUD01015300.1~~GFUD01015300.1.p1  ORF type:complete len:560 (+),score=174.35 GFUD01015300.1:105-1784(+)